MASDITTTPKEAPMVATVATPWLTRREAAAYVRVSLETFDRWVKDGRITRHKVEGLQSVRFHTDHLDALMVPVPREETSAPTRG